MSLELIEKVKVHENDFEEVIAWEEEKVKLNGLLSKRLNRLLQLTPKGQKEREGLVELYNTTQYKKDMIYYYNIVFDGEEKTISRTIEDIPEYFSLDELGILLTKYQKEILIQLELK